MTRSRTLVLLLSSWVWLVPSLLAQQQLGRIIGQIRVSRGDFPPHSILVELQLRGSTINSVYADDQGRFGFYNLEGNPYHVLIHDEAFYPIDELAIVNPLTSPSNMVQVQLEPRQSKKQEPLQNRVTDSNPYIVDLAEYRHGFPKKAVNEFDKGVDADRQGKRDEAIRHYQKALRIAPGFYPAHNNLGSSYVSKSDFAAALQEFEQVIQLNQSDAAAYFNLSNVCMLLGQISKAREFLGEGLRRDPNSALGHFILGSLNFKTGMYAEAERALRQAIQISPVMAQPRLQLVNLFLQQGRKADAVAELHDFVTTFPDSAFASKAKQMLQQLNLATNSSSSVPN
jgi:tetratricopeptide (TPR) repeat protein